MFGPAAFAAMKKPGNTFRSSPRSSTGCVGTTFDEDHQPALQNAQAIASARLRGSTSPTKGSQGSIKTLWIQWFD